VSSGDTDAGDELFVVGDPGDPAREVAAGVIAESGQGTTTPAAIHVPRTFASLRHRNFALFWAAAIISNSGGTMQAVTVPFVIYAITGSAAWLGISTAVTFVPTVLVGPIAGAVADRYPRRQVLLVTQTVQMAAAFALWGLWVSGRATVASILGVVFLSSVAGGINIASWQAFVPSLVPRRDLMNAVRLNSIQFTLARAVGPALAGLVLGRFGAGTSFMVNAVTYLLVIAALVRIPPQPNAGATGAPRQSVVHEFVDGLRYMRRRPALLQCVMNTMVLAAASFALVQLAPAIAHKQLHIGKSSYGYLVASEGLASILSSFWLANRGDRLRRSRTTMTGLGFAVFGSFVLGAATNFWFGAVAFFAIGLGHTLTAIPHNTTIQAQVSDAYRGRVLAVYLMSVQLGVPLGSVLLGATADATGTRSLAVGSGVFLLVYFAFVLSRLGGLRALDPDEELAVEPPS
jgi:MFS family permease